MYANESPATESVWAAQKIEKLRSRHSGRLGCDSPAHLPLGSPPTRYL